MVKLYPLLVALVGINWGYFTAAAAAAVDAQPTTVDLVTFDGTKDTTWHFHALNDPVMGGQSHSTWTVNSTSQTANWVGETKIVPKLKAPGFCNAETTDGLGILRKFNDASAFTHLLLRVRSAAAYTGWKVSFAADTINPQFGSYKSEFNLTSPGDGKFHTVAVPFDHFSNDWSSFTGRCDTTDPGGRTHKCCSAANPEVCPTKKNLHDITHMGLWTEGVAGKFDADIAWIRAGFGAGDCEATEYCCPDAKACLTPTKTSCKADASVCGSDETCCPLTKLCVKVGKSCSSPCSGTDSYCCPDAKACLAPTNPGVLCSGAKDCAASEICCPLTNLCVSAGAKCDPGVPAFMYETAAPSTKAAPVPAAVEAVPAVDTASAFIGKNTCTGHVQPHLQYNMSNRYQAEAPSLPIPLAKGEELAEAICCDSAFAPFAEPTGYYARPDVKLFKYLEAKKEGATTTFYDSVCGIPLFVVPRNRTLADFEAETTEHGWPSFRTAELATPDAVKIMPDGEVISKCGTHLGSNLPDAKGNRYCLDLSCVSGNPAKVVE